MFTYKMAMQQVRLALESLELVGPIPFESTPHLDTYYQTQENLEDLLEQLKDLQLNGAPE